MNARYEVAIRRSDDGRVLVLTDRSLPGFSIDAPPPWPVVAVVADEMRARYGLDVVTLRAASVDGTSASGAETRRVYEAELVGGSPPAGAAWVDDPDLGEELAGLLRPAGGGRQPWYRPGWFAEMSAWIDERLAGAGIRRRGRIRQVRSWGRAALLTLDTDRGHLWAKAVPDVFSHEVAVTELLADIDPGVVPPVVASDRALGRIITEHVEGPALDAIGEPAVWAAAMSRLAEIQRVLAADPEALSVAGVAAAPLGRLADSLPALLADDDLLRVDRPGGLTGAEAASLRDRLPTWVEACRALAASGVPDSLEHGDLTADEVILGAMGPVFLDWSDGSIAHPFLSAASILLDRAAPAGGEDDLVAAYLGPWLATGQVAPFAGRDALALARTVLPFHVAALYSERILPGLEQRWEVEGVVPDAMRAILPRVTRQRIPDDVLSAAHARARAREAHDWSEADRLRTQIEAAGWKIADRGTDFALTPAAPPDVTDGAQVRYGSSASVPSRLGEPPVGPATVIVLATDWPDDLARAVAGLRATSPAGTSLVVVADAPSAAQDAALAAIEAGGPAGSSRLPTEIVRTSERLGHATATNIGLRRATGAVAILLDTSLEPTGDIVTPLVHALDDTSVAVAGGWGIVSGDLRKFEDAPAGDVDAIEGYLQAFRRADFTERGPLDERFRFYRNLDIWWSLVLRDEGEGDRPRRAVRLAGLPIARHDHRGYTSLPDDERDRQSKRNFYRIIDRFGSRRDLLVRLGGDGAV